MAGFMACFLSSTAMAPYDIWYVTLTYSYFYLSLVEKMDQIADMCMPGSMYCSQTVTMHRLHALQ